MATTTFRTAPYEKTTTQHSYSNLVHETTTSSYEQSRRQISSVIVAEEFLQPLPETDRDVYEEVPVVEERIIQKPVKSVIEVEKVVPKFEVEYVDKIREIPQIEYVEKEVEREIVQEVIRTVPIKQIIERPREVIKTVPKIEYVQVEKVVHVPGKTIEVPKVVDITQNIDVIKRVDKPVPVVVAQTINPVITESLDVIDVDVYEYIPTVIPVDVHVAKPVESQLLAVGPTQHLHQPVSVPPAQYNTLLRNLNKHLSHEELTHLPYIKDENNSIPFLRADETPEVVYPVQDSRVFNRKSVMTSGEYSFNYPTSRQMTNQSNRMLSHNTNNGLQHLATCETMTSKQDEFELRSCKSAVSRPKSSKSGKLSQQPLPKKKLGCSC